MANKSSNKNLRSANKAKKDEFYTQLVDIEKELKHYRKHLKIKLFIVIAMTLVLVIFFITFLITLKSWALKT